MTGHNRFYTKVEMENVMKESLAGYAELEARLQAANARADAAEERLRTIRIAACDPINLPSAILKKIQVMLEQTHE